MADAGSSYLNTPTRTEEQARADVLAEEVKRVRSGIQPERVAVARLVSRGWHYNDAHHAINAALREAPRDVAVISQHERGFWQADIYKESSDWTDAEWNSGCAPDAFCTAPKREAVIAEVRRVYPDAALREGGE